MFVRLNSKPVMQSIFYIDPSSRMPLYSTLFCLKPTAFTKKFQRLAIIPQTEQCMIYLLWIHIYRNSVYLSNIFQILIFIYPI